MKITFQDVSTEETVGCWDGITLDHAVRLVEAVVIVLSGKRWGVTRVSPLTPGTLEETIGVWRLSQESLIPG